MRLKVGNKLKVGDKVLIRDDLICGLGYGGLYFKDGMAKGIVATVDSISNFWNIFTIKEDRGGFLGYTAEMCVGKVLEDNKVVKINEV